MLLINYPSLGRCEGNISRLAMFDWGFWINILRLDS